MGRGGHGAYRTANELRDVSAARRASGVGTVVYRSRRPTRGAARGDSEPWFVAAEIRLRLRRRGPNDPHPGIVPCHRRGDACGLLLSDPCRGVLGSASGRRAIEGRRRNPENTQPRFHRRIGPVETRREPTDGRARAGGYWPAGRRQNDRRFRSRAAEPPRERRGRRAVHVVRIPRCCRPGSRNRVRQRRQPCSDPCNLTPT